MHRVFGQQCREFALLKVERAFAERAITASSLSGGFPARLVVIGDVLETFLCRADCAATDDDYVVGSQVVECRRQTILEQRKPMLHAGEAPAIAHRFVKRVLRGGRAEQLAISAAEALDAVFVEQGFACR